MLSIEWIRNVDYYLDQARADYYFKGGEPPGIWWGRGAEELGLTGVVTKRALTRLFQGFSPAGKPLVQNAGAEDRQAAWDLTFSAPKSVSVWWSQVDGLTQRRIQELHLAAVIDGLQYLQDVAAFTRRGKNGLRIELANLVAALFEHGTSRELDAHLHTHCIVINAATRSDGTTGTIKSDPLYLHKLTAGAVYRASLAALLQEEFGVLIERDGTSFRIVGVPKDLCWEQSKRRQQVLDALKSRGFHSAQAAAVAVLDTRRSKDIHPPRAKLFPIWRKTNEQYGFTAAAANAMYGQAPTIDLDLETATTLQIALDGLLKEQAHFSEQELVRANAIEAQARGVPAHRVLAAVRAILAEEVEIVPLGKRDDELRYTSREMFELEVDMLKEVDATKDNADHVVSPDVLDAIIKEKLPISSDHSGDEFLRNSEQRQAVEHVTLKPGQIQVLKGVAGSGKTFAQGVCREAWERAGFQVVGMALSGNAARELEDSTGIKSDTLAMCLTKLDAFARLSKGIRGPFRGVKKELTRLANASKFHLTPQTIVVLDEAGMVATRQMARLLRHVLDAGAKLVIAGDDTQLQPIEAGGPMQAIAKRVGRFELTHNTRQTLDSNDPNPQWAREAVRHFANGNASKALKLFAERGRVFIAESCEEAMRRLVGDWSEQGLVDPAQHVMLAGRNTDVDRLNVMAQAARASSVTRDTPRLQLDSLVLMEGDHVLFTRKSRLLGVENGDRGVITKMDVRRQTLAVELHGRKRRVFVPLKDYPHIKLGYAMTTHKAQGATFQSAFVLAAGKMQDLHLSYVQSSRAKESTRFYTDRYEANKEFASLAKQMSRSRKKDLAHDVFEQASSKDAKNEESKSATTSSGPAPKTSAPKKRKPRAKPTSKERAVFGKVRPTKEKRQGRLHPLASDALACLTIETTTDPKYLQAAIDRYGVLPGGIVVEGEASCSVPIRSLQIDPQEPGNIIVNGTHSFHTGLDPDELVCLWHAVYETDKSDNFGALSQSSVVGVTPDTSVADALMRADDYLGQIAYGYDRHFNVAPTRLAGAVNPFVAEAAAVRSRLDDHAARIAENFLDSIHPQAFVCFSGAAFELTVDQVARTLAGKVTIAIATTQGNQKVLHDANEGSRRFPFHYPAIARMGADFKEYARLEQSLAHCVVYAAVVQLLRLAKRQNADLTQHESIRALYVQRKRVPPPGLHYTRRSAEFVALTRETACAIDRQLKVGGRSQKLARHGNVAGFRYAQMAGDPGLTAVFKSELERLSTKDERHSYVADQIYSPLRWCHDQLIGGYLAGANQYDASPADEARFLTAALDLCRPALQGPVADEATTCCFLQVMCRRNPSYDPLPELRQLLSAERFGGSRINLLPFATLTWILRGRAASAVSWRDRTQLAAAIKRLEYELDAEYLSGRALEWYQFLGKHLDPREHLQLLETFQRRKWTLDDIGPIVDGANPQTFVELMALLSVKKVWSENATTLNAMYLHENNPFLLSYPLLAELSTEQLNDLLTWLEHEAQTDANPPASRWWANVKTAMNGEGQILFLEELIVRDKTLSDLYSLTQQQSVSHPQAAIFWLDFQDLQKKRRRTETGSQPKRNSI